MIGYAREPFVQWNVPFNWFEILRRNVSACLVCPMPLFKYFLYVGSALSLLFFAWSVYLEPPAAEVDRPSVKSPGVFRPTPAPPTVPDGEQQRIGQTPAPSSASPRSNERGKIARTKQKKQGTQVARRRGAPDRTFAYFPQRPFFFVWR